MAGVSTVVAGFSTGVPTLSVAVSVAFSAAAAVLRTLVVAPLAEAVAFLVAFLVVVEVRLAAVRVRLADLVTSVWATLVSSTTEPLTTVTTFAASLRAVVRVALAERSMSAVALRAEVTAPLTWATVVSAWATRSL